MVGIEFDRTFDKDRMIGRPGSMPFGESALDHLDIVEAGKIGPCLRGQFRLLLQRHHRPAQSRQQRCRITGRASDIQNA